MHDTLAENSDKSSLIVKQSSTKKDIILKDSLTKFSYTIKFNLTKIGNIFEGSFAKISNPRKDESDKICITKIHPSKVHFRLILPQILLDSILAFRIRWTISKHVFGPSIPRIDTLLIQFNGFFPVHGFNSFYSS